MVTRNLENTVNNSLEDIMRSPKAGDARYASLNIQTVNNFVSPVTSIYTITHMSTCICSFRVITPTNRFITM